jgi:hypothetical protein
MKTKKIISLTALALIASSTGASTVFAADGATYDSNGVITYIPSTTPTTPVDPTDPAKPVVPTDPTDPTGPNPGTNGPLSLDYASSFDFGTQEITSADKTYFAAANPLSDGSTRPNWVQVTDNRGSLSGWTLSVEATDFTNGKTGTGSVLNGATLKLDNGHIVSASDAPADQSVASVTLTPGASSGTILGATDGNGAGTNLLVWGDDTTKASSVSLAVPGKTTKLADTYQSTLTWTLTDTPAN